MTHSTDSPAAATRPRHSNLSVAALAALYQGEKTDASYVFNTAMVMMGIAVAYLVGAIPFVDKLSYGPIGAPSATVPHAWAYLLLLPIPLWLVVAFHSLITLNAMSHGISVTLIETELFGITGMEARGVPRDMIGSAAGDKIMDITRSALVHRVVTFVVYGGVGVFVIGFTGYTWSSAQQVIARETARGSGNLAVVALAIYAILLLLVLASWWVGLRMINHGRRAADERNALSGNEDR